MEWTKTEEEILADSGYCSETNLEALESADEPEKKIEGFIATERLTHGEYKEPRGELRGPLPKEVTRVDRMRRKLEDQREGSVCSAEGDRSFSGVRPDQARSRIPAVSVAGHREGAGRMVSGLSHTQHLEAVPALLRVRK